MTDQRKPETRAAAFSPYATALIEALDVSTGIMQAQRMEPTIDQATRLGFELGWYACVNLYEGHTGKPAVEPKPDDDTLELPWKGDTPHGPE
jgi:hypothetical protein